MVSSMVRVRIGVKIRVSIMVRVSIRTRMGGVLGPISLLTPNNLHSSQLFLLSATYRYFSSIRSLSRCILVLPSVAFPFIIPSIIIHDAVMNHVLTHTLTTPLRFPTESH